MFCTDFYICGIAPFEENLAILSYVNQDQQLVSTINVLFIIMQCWEQSIL